MSQEKTGRAIEGGLGGAATGAAVGTAVMPGIGTAIGAGAGAALGGLAGFFGGGGSKESGLRLPPELEFRMLEDAFRQFDQIKQDYERASKMYDTYEQRFNLLAQSSEANLPPEEMRRALAKNSADIALSMGQNIDDLIKNGFLSAEDKADIDSLKNLESQEFRDPRYDQARDQQKQQLLANLRRGGVEGEQLTQALANFDNESILGAFSRGEELRTAQAARIGNRIGISSGLRQQGFGMAQGTLNSQLGALGSYGNMIGQTAGLYGMGMQAGTAGLAANQGLRGEGQNLYNQLGEYSFSKDSKKYLKSGLPQSGQSFTPQGFKDREKAIKDAKNREVAQRMQESKANDPMKQMYDLRKA